MIVLVGKIVDLGVGGQICLPTPEIFENQGRQMMNICVYAQIVIFSWENEENMGVER